MEFETVVALPEPQYLQRIGALAYTVSSLEWTILGDLSALQPPPVDNLRLDRLEGKSTGQIADVLKDNAHLMPSPELQIYVAAAGRALKAIARDRNDFVHARPATHHVEDQRLLRAEIGEGKKPTGHRFWIDDAWLIQKMALFNRHIHVVNEARSAAGLPGDY